MSESALIGLASTGFAFLAGWLAVLAGQAWRRRAKIRKRMGPIASLLTVQASEVAPVSVQQRRGDRKLTVVAWLDARFPLAGGVRTALIGLGAGGLAFVLLVPVLIFFGVSQVLALIVAAGIGGSVAWQLGKILESAGRTEFSARFLVVLEDFHRMVRYGIPSQQALGSSVAAAEEPVKTSLRNIALDTEFGIPIGVAMDREARRVRVSELSMFAAIVATQHATGGNLSESVANLAKMLRERIDNRSRMKASTAESRITMIIMALVPFAAVALQAVTQPDLVTVLMNEARHLAGIGLGLIVAGLLISWMIIRGAQR